MKNIIEQISHWELLDIDKPARYLGGEVNQTPLKKNAELRVCLVFPDLYELGMSNLALKIFYETLNKHPKIMAERAFSPWPDFENLLRRKGLPLYSLETGTPLSDFDIIFITLPYEMTFTNVLNLLDMGGIDILWKNRKNGPFVIAGGPSASNPLPVARFMDAVSIGDGEEAIVEICEKIMEASKSGATRSETKKSLISVEGTWVPEFPAQVKRRIFADFGKSEPPLKPVIPNVQATHNRATLEILRGCVNGCRFCNAGFYYRPKRERPVGKLTEYAEKLLHNTGEESLGLLSLSTSDYSHLEELLEQLGNKKLYPEQSISIPSLRMSDKTISLLNSSKSIRKGGLTFAPEAGTQRLRDIINKQICEEDIIKVMQATSDSDYRTVKLYFMIGLPFEKDEDVEGIVELCRKLENIGKICKPKKQISISLSGFVPKAFTPFQWAQQDSMEELRRKRLIVCRGLERSRSKVSWREEYLCLLESVISRGDERIGDLLYHAFKQGCKFDGWYEFFSREKWEKAFEESGINPVDYLKSYSINEPLPWNFIDFGVPETYLRKEYQLAAEMAGETLT